MNVNPEQDHPLAPAERVSYADDLAVRLSNDSSRRAVLFILLIVGFNIVDHFIDPDHAMQALYWRLGAAVAITSVQGLWVLARSKSYDLYRRLVLVHCFTVPLCLSGAVAQLDMGLVYGLANFIFIYIWIPSVLPSRRDALLGGILSGAAILGVTWLQGERGLVLGNIAGLIGLGTILAMLTATKFEAALRRAWEHEQAAANEARTDMLTGARNRRHFEEAALAEWMRCQRYGRKAALLLFDLDKFKQVNDRFGHSAGDIVLRHIAQLCRKHVRDIDTVARIGGEEFALLLPETDLEAAAGLAERLRQRIADEEIRVGKQTLQVSASFGVGALFDETADWKQSVRRVDAALYRAKSKGRNCVEQAE